VELDAAEASEATEEHDPELILISASVSDPNEPLCVLYVEDNPENANLMEQIMARRPGTRLLTANRGEAGLRQAREAKPDVIFLDFHLPDLQGDEVLRTLKRETATRDIPVYMLSADVLSPKIEKLKKNGAVDYLTKPIAFETLLNAIMEVEQQRNGKPLKASI
jgi:CheY-like chemotaxis protein